MKKILHIQTVSTHMSFDVDKIIVFSPKNILTHSSICCGFGGGLRDWGLSRGFVNHGRQVAQEQQRQG